MPQFSLGNIFVATAGLAAGFAIWRLPKGNWTDVPIYFLSFYFAASMARRAVDLRRFIRAHPLPRDQRCGHRLVAVGMLAMAIVLVACWVARYLAADGMILNPLGDYGLDFYLAIERLPNDLAVLVMLAIVSGQIAFNQRQTAAPRRKVLYAVVAVLGGAVALIAYWTDRMLIPFLIYLAVNGISRSQPAWLLPPERNIRDAVWADQFAVASLIGTCLVALNLFIFWSVARSWNRPRWKWLLMIVLIVLLVMQCACVAWLYGRGVWHLSPEMAESIHWPAPDRLLLAAAITLVAAAMIVRPAATIATSTLQIETMRPRYFYETWIAGLSLGLVGLAVLINLEIGQIKAMISNPFSSRLDWQSVAYGLMFTPAQAIYWGAVIGGFMFAWQRFRRPASATSDMLIRIQPGKFFILTLALTCSLILSAPIIASLAFSFWLKTN